MKKVVGKNNYSMGNSSMIASAPYAQLKMLGSPTRDKDYEGHENSVWLTFECQSFADGQTAIDSVYNIDAVSHQTMIDLGFTRIYGAELIDNADSSIKRVVSRYRMQYTGKFLGQ